MYNYIYKRFQNPRLTLYIYMRYDPKSPTLKIHKILVRKNNKKFKYKKRLL